MSDGENELDVINEIVQPVGVQARLVAGSGAAAQESFALIKQAIDWLQVRHGGVFEDWGCGYSDPKGPWVRHLVDRMQYVGVDKSGGPGVGVVADLIHRRCDADSIFMHHVLGTAGAHWSIILDNALYSFKMRMAIVESPVLVPTAMLVQAIKVHAWPHKYVQLPDGRDLFTVERA